MSYYPTAYETTAGRIAETQKLETAIKAALITSSLSETAMGLSTVGACRPAFVLGNSLEENGIPPFIYPYLIRNFKQHPLLVSDLRMFRNTSQSYVSQQEFEKGVRNLTEYGLMKSRALLGALWLDDDQRPRLRAQFSFAGTVFGLTLSQAISKAYALDFSDQSRLLVLSIYYYHLLFSTKSVFESGDNAREVAVVHIMKASKLPAKDVYEIIDNLPAMGNIAEYCAAVKQVVANVRLKDFNVVMLLSLIRNLWYGQHAKELLAVALEHPPTWIPIVFSTMTERGFKSSTLYKFIELASKRGNGDEFRMNYLDLLRVQTKPVTESVDEVVIRNFED